MQTIYSVIPLVNIQRQQIPCVNNNINNNTPGVRYMLVPWDTYRSRSCCRTPAGEDTSSGPRHTHTGNCPGPESWDRNRSCYRSAHMRTSPGQTPPPRSSFGGRCQDSRPPHSHRGRDQAPVSHCTSAHPVDTCTHN